MAWEWIQKGVKPWLLYIEHSTLSVHHQNGNKSMSKELCIQLIKWINVQRTAPRSMTISNYMNLFKVNAHTNYQSRLEINLEIKVMNWQWIQDKGVWIKHLTHEMKYNCTVTSLYQPPPLTVFIQAHVSNEKGNFHLNGWTTNWYYRELMILYIKVELNRILQGLIENMQFPG